jgi:hypothetical protein
MNKDFTCNCGGRLRVLYYNENASINKSEYYVCGTCKSLYKIVIESKVVEKREVIHYE